MKQHFESVKNAVHIKCGECCGFDWAVVLDCPAQDCPLYHYRPKSRRDTLKARYWSDKDQRMKAIPRPRPRVITDEQRRAASERMSRLHDQPSAKEYRKCPDRSTRSF